MQIHTTRFGSLEVEERSVLSMRRGLLGFESFHRYILIQDGENSAFRWLQCVDSPSLAFVVVDPMQWFPHYNVVLSDEDVAALDIRDPDEAGICAIVTLSPHLEEMTVNLLGPVVMNVRNGRAEQVVLDDPRYSTKHRLLPDVALAGNNAA